MQRVIIYIHGKGGSAEEANHYRPLFPGSDVVGLDYTSQNPWDAQDEFPRLFDSYSKGYDEVILIANSIGAFFAMSALAEKGISRALFISPIVNMEKLIADMMLWANVTEDELQSKKEIPTAFGEKQGADLTVMEDGEHWFHTNAQMQFLDDWIRRSIP